MSAKRGISENSGRSHSIARRLNTLSVGLLLAATPAAAQWNTQSPLPTHLDVRGVGAPTAEHVFIATDDNSFDDGGALFESADGGASWVQRDVPTSLGSPFNGIFFRDGSNGWVYGNENYRTTDGGTTWTALPLLGSTYFMEFYTPTFGLASGNFDHYVSHDGGLSWAPSPNDMSAFAFADDLTGIGVADSALYRTNDGGTTFTQVFAGASDAVTFLSSTTAVGIVDGTFVRSTDGGVTWTAGSATEGRRHLLAVSADIVLAWGRAGSFPDYDDRIFRSDDGGLTWTDLGEVMDPGAFANAFAFAVPDPQTVVASDGAGNMYRSGDAGLSWTQTFSSIGSQPSFLSSAAPVFTDAQTGYFGYGSGFVIKTTDGGSSWSQISSGSGQSLHDVVRFANGDMIAVGDNGTVLASNGSSPWTIESAPTNVALVAAQVVGTQDLIVADEQGHIHTSSDGGASWSSSSSAPSGLEAEDLHFSNLLDGWVIGFGFAGGALFHTTDGGGSWTPVPDFAGAYVAVDFEGTNGWAANVGGRYYRTTDGGASWIQEELPGSSISITDMDFFDQGRGYAVGRWGYAARSDDGGLTWQMLPTPNQNDMLTHIHLLGANELWVSTNEGVAYYSATAGMSWSVLDIGSAGFGNFASITAMPGGDAWTVGSQGYIEHFTGPPPPPANQLPTAAFDFVANGLSVDFTDLSTDADGVITAWSWEFGDGAVSSEQNPSHTYTAANTYIVRLTVTDDDGDTDQTGAIVVAQPGPGGTFGDFTEVTPIDPLFVTPQNEDFWVATTAPADYDNDGDLDVAVLGFYVVYNVSATDQLVLFRNDGQVGPGEWEFSYTEVPLGTVSAGASDLAWGDVDGDGDQDLAVGSDAQTVIYSNDAGELVVTDTVLPAYWEDNDQADFDLRSITWADYDNDGDLDLLLPSVWDPDTFSFRTALMRNDGTNGTGGWIFTEATSPFASTAHAQSAWADYDGDEDLDLLLVNLAPLTNNGFIRRYRNDGNGNFAGEDILGTLSVEHGEAQWGDYDGDGDLDVLVVGNLKETDGTFTLAALRVYRNDAGVFARTDVISCVPCDGWFDLTAATWADYDSDGDIDILLTGTYNSGSQIEGRAVVYANDGTGVFSVTGSELPAPRASGSRGGTFTWLDLDADADLDYFIAGEYFVPGGNGLIEAQIHAYRNDAEGQNAAPTMPLNLDAVVTEGDPRVGSLVSLSWSPSNDDHTPIASITYDLQLHRNGAPLANPHRLPEPGNISAVSEWTLSGLPNGIYTWTLRAVDSAYNGSSLAIGAFNIGSAVPVEPAPAAPRTYAFSQNHPNPFNPSTTFSFALPERAHVELTVFDPLGRLVARLVDETRGPGVHNLRWDANGLASGTYFVRLTTSKFSQVRRIQLLK